jgi:Alw26I/Eco31I/Esp3I family type II restriction m6 adenine DNA methyltransferase
LLESHRLSELSLIPEDARLFVGVNQPTCIAVVGAKASPTSVVVRRRVTSPKGLRSRATLRLQPELIRTVDPVDHRIPDCDSREIAWLAQLHEHPRLDDLAWAKNLRGELDLTVNREYIRPTRGLPLVRGDQIERYRTDLPTEKARWVSPLFVEQALSLPKVPHVGRPRVVGRQCSYLKKARRLSFALVEEGRIVGNSCNYICIDGRPAPLPEREALLYLLAILNSDWAEWRFRVTSSTNHVGNYELDALPIPEPADVKAVSNIVDLSAHLCAAPDDSAADEELNERIGRLYGIGEAAPV